jgi:hypothetical protein
MRTRISKFDLILILVALAVCFSGDIYSFIKDQIDVTPTTQEICAIIVSEGKEEPKLPKEQILALQSLDIVKYMEGKKYPFFTIDPDIQPVKGKELPGAFKAAKEDAKGKSNPYLLIYDKNGELLEETIFTDEANLKQHLTKWGGL